MPAHSKIMKGNNYLAQIVHEIQTAVLFADIQREYPIIFLLPHWGKSLFGCKVIKIKITVSFQLGLDEKLIEF